MLTRFPQLVHTIICANTRPVRLSTHPLLIQQRELGHRAPVMDEASAKVKIEHKEVSSDGTREAEAEASASTVSHDPSGGNVAKGFTSESFKIALNNVPRIGYQVGVALASDGWGYSVIIIISLQDFRKYLASLKLNPHRIKMIKPGISFINFSCEEDRMVKMSPLPPSLPL